LSRSYKSWLCIPVTIYLKKQRSLIAEYRTIRLPLWLHAQLKAALLLLFALCFQTTVAEVGLWRGVPWLFINADASVSFSAKKFSILRRSI
jgi:hypothetical protein